jgi:acyl dehydratase
MRTVEKDELFSLIGEEIGVSDWIRIDQDRINVFADVTEDHQFIHVDVEKAKSTPFGATIAHGFLTLSLLSKFSEQGSLTLKGVKMGMNYGFDKVRFLSPVPVDSKVRGRFTLKDAVEKRPGQFLITYDITVEIEGGDKPALICEWMSMQFC